ncbi:MAG TPA: HIT family protein [Acidimicrobiales bacterium]|nr:HIT family protein [Acidimicrobiales bacterium]
MAHAPGVSEVEQPATCFVCSKHRAEDDAEGGILYLDKLVYAGHVHTMGGTGAYRGHLVLEPRRHVEGLGLLDDAEAKRIGWLTNRLAALLRDELAAEHVYSFVLGGASVTARTPAHLHVHLVPRYPGTPPEFAGTAITHWPDAPRVDPTGMRALVTELRARLLAGAPPA